MNERITASLAVLLLLTLYLARPLSAGDGVFKPVMVSAPPVIDGKLDDPAWKNAVPLTDFKTFKPDYGKLPSQKTEMYILYDRHYIYFGFRCLDSEPSKIKAALSKRDNIDADDLIGIVVDTFNDHQSGYLFVVNPLGIQMDGMLDADGNGDSSFDTVWSSRGEINGVGYTAEMAIPFKSLRFPPGKKIVMSIAAVRWFSRYSEQASLPAISPDKGSILSQLMPFELDNIKYQRTVEILPAVTHSQRSVQDQGSLKLDNRTTDFSLTGKLGLTSGLTLDATYNPDFSQVEADAGQIDVNLRYALYYPEKRPFFLEGLENFNFGGRSEANYLGYVVNTRTIVDPVMGFKLNGKMGNRNMVSTIFAVDDYPGRVTEEPELAGRNALFGILRYKRIFSQDSYVGGFYTDREFAGEYNRLAGADGRFRLNNRSFAEFSYFRAFSRDLDASAGYQGDAFSLRYAYSTRTVDAETGYIGIAKDFRTDVGYLMRTGIRSVPLFFMYHIYPRSKFFQKIEPFYWGQHTWDTFSNLFESTNVFVLRFAMPRSSQIRFDAILANEVFAHQRFNRNAWRVQGYTQIFKQLYLEMMLRHGNSIYYDPDNPYAGRSSRIDAGLVFQPIQAISSSLSLSFADFHRASDGQKIYDYTILRNRTVFQLNRFLFFRSILEYNFFYKQLNADFLASFTYIPGTVIYIGYGSVYEKLRWDQGAYVPADDLLQTQRSFFFKASYLWRF